MKSLILFLTIFLPKCIVQAEDTLSPMNCSIAEIQDALNSGTNCTEIVQMFMLQYKTYNNDTLALISFNPNLTTTAKAVDDRRRKLSGNRPLDCVPIVISDAMDVEDMLTTLGSLAMSDNLATRYASVVKSLLDQGAVLIGKGNMAEFGQCGTQSRSTIGGSVNNPYGSSNTPYGADGINKEDKVVFAFLGGVSSAVAAGFGLIGVGIDGEGSLLSPAAASGLFGIRTSGDGKLMEGVFVTRAPFTTIGLVGRHAKDVAYAWGTLKGNPNLFAPSLFDGSSTYFVPEASIGIVSNFLRQLTINDPSTGEAVDYQPSQATLDAMYGDFTELLRQKYIKVVTVTMDSQEETEYLRLMQEINSAAEQGQCLDAETHAALEQYFAGTKYNTLNSWLSVKDLTVVDFTGANFTSFFDDIAGASNSGDTSCEALDSLRSQLRDFISAFSKRHSVKTLAFPAAPGDPPSFDSANYCPSAPTAATPTRNLPSYLDYPAITFPITFSVGAFPIGVNIVGQPGQELLLLRIAHAWELVSGLRFWQEPSLTPEVAGNQIAYEGCGQAANIVLCRCKLMLKRISRINQAG